MFIWTSQLANSNVIVYQVISFDSCKICSTSRARVILITLGLDDRMIGKTPKCFSYLSPQFLHLAEEFKQCKTQRFSENK
jgi:hypothetical protein